jgi:hypothetical protein
MVKLGQVLYRVCDSSVGVVGILSYNADRRAWDSKEEVTGKLYYIEYYVVKLTRCGYYVSEYSSGQPYKFINKSWLKKFAHETKEDALKSFIARKGIRILHLERQLRKSKASLYLAEHGVIEDEYNYDLITKVK